MVKRQRILATTLVLGLLALLLASVLTQDAKAAEVEYHLDKQWVKIWINQDGTIDLQYTLGIVCERGRISYVFFDQPVSDFTIGEAFDSDGHQLTIEDATQGNDYKVKVFLNQPITDGQRVELTATTNVGHMIWEDQTNPGNVGLQFIPTPWSVPIDDLRVMVVLPPGVSKDQIRVTPDWDNVYADPNEAGRLVVYWERMNLSPNTKFQVGVSFPATSVEHYETTKPTESFLGPVAGILGFIGVVAVIAVVAVLVKRAARRNYLDPKMQMESLGIKRGLTAVEAAYLLDVPPARIIVMMLYGLLLKRAVWVKSTQPSLKLQVTETPGGNEPPSAGAGFRYYEKDFLRAIRDDGTLDEGNLAEAYMRVRSAVENSLRGYCRADTVEYYKRTVQTAWGQVEKAGTPDLASKMFDENLLWLMLDENFRSKSEDAFKETDFQPLPFWWWYWYGYTQYHPNPAYDPSAGPGQPPPKIPGSEFANNIATAMEKTAGNFVTNIEKFASSILPAPSPSQDISSKPVRHNANCACACVSCACVCACVSCACACASGGGVG